MLNINTPLTDPTERDALVREIVEGMASARSATKRQEFRRLITQSVSMSHMHVLATLRDRPGFQHVVLTGRNAPPALIEAADLVSEVVKVKHPMDEGIRAQQGIEW